jgi:hypothetical protein
MGETALLSWPRETPPPRASTTNNLSTIFQEILKASKAQELPSATQLQASADFYYNYLYHALPIFDKSDCPPSPSILAKQTTYFLGCLVRFPDEATSLALQSAYEKIRAILYTRLEGDKLVILSALLALSCWSPNPPDIVSLDTSWHWVGSAVRLAIQMGLHREATYQTGSDTDLRKRLWWAIFVSYPSSDLRIVTDIIRMRRSCMAQVTVERSLVVQMISMQVL